MKEGEPDFTIVTAWFDVREFDNHPLKDVAIACS